MEPLHGATRPRSPSPSPASRISSRSASEPLLTDDPNVSIVVDDIAYDRIPVVLQAHDPDVLILDVGALDDLATVRALSVDHPGHAPRAARPRPVDRGVRAAARLRRERLPRQGHAGARRAQRDPPRRARAAGHAPRQPPRGRRPRRPFAAHAPRGRRAASPPPGPLERAASRSSCRSASRRCGATPAASIASSASPHAARWSRCRPSRAKRPPGPSPLRASARRRRRHTAAMRRPLHD